MTKDEFETLVAKFTDIRTIYGEDEVALLEQLNRWVKDNPSALSSDETKQLYMRVTRPPGAAGSKAARVNAEWEAEQVRRYLAEDPEELPEIDLRWIAPRGDGGTLDMDGELFECRQSTTGWEIRMEDGPWMRAVPGAPSTGTVAPPSTARNGKVRSE